MMPVCLPRFLTADPNPNSESSLGKGTGQAWELGEGDPGSRTSWD